MKKVASNSVVFKNEMIFKVNVMAPYMEKLLIEGNKDWLYECGFPETGITRYFIAHCLMA